MIDDPGETSRKTMPKGMAVAGGITVALLILARVCQVNISDSLAVTIGLVVAYLVCGGGWNDFSKKAKDEQAGSDRNDSGPKTGLPQLRRWMGITRYLMIAHLIAYGYQMAAMNRYEFTLIFLSAMGAFFYSHSLLANIRDDK